MARILVIDDEAPMRSMMAAVLQKFGHTVVEAKAAREGLRLHAETPADLVITDLVMGGMDGIELMRRLQASSPNTPVIGVSGDRHSTIYLNMAKLIGAEHVLAKPFQAQELADAVHRLLKSAAPASSKPAPAAG